MALRRIPLCKGPVSSKLVGICIWLAFLTWTSFTYAADVIPPYRGFDRNVGQYESSVLFAFDEQIFYQSSVQLAPQLSIQFANASPLAIVSGMNPAAFPLNLYLGSDPKRWRENVPHFATVSYAQIYPGIDAEWLIGVSETNLPMLRFRVAPGADPQNVILRLQSTAQLSWTNRGYSIFVDSPRYFELRDPIAYQAAKTGTSQIAVNFVTVDGSSFRPAVGAYDPALPLMIEFGPAPNSKLNTSRVISGSDDSAVLTGSQSRIYSQNNSHGFVGKVTQTGRPVFLSLFDGVAAEWLSAGPGGEITLAGPVYVQFGMPPTTPGAPKQIVTGDFGDAWVGQFDGSGKLRAATFTGTTLQAFVTDTDGAAYFGTRDSVVKWIPGNPQFSFTAPIRGVTSLAVNAAGSVAYAAAGSGGQPTTPGAFQNKYNGPWDLYAGKFDRVSGKIQTATYVPIFGQTSGQFTPYHAVSLAPNGSIWISSAMHFLEGGDAQTLVALSAGGEQVFHSESVTDFPVVAFDSSGNVLVAISTSWPNLATTPDAPRRAPCPQGLALHLRKLTSGGALLSATYLHETGKIVQFDGPDRLFIDATPFSFKTDLQRVSLDFPTVPGIACVLHTASRQGRTKLARGGLSTIVGNQLGPLEQSNASIDKSGNLPFLLAGVDVVIGSKAVPLLSVQQGLVTFYLPKDTPMGETTLEIRFHGVTQSGVAVTVIDAFDFGILTADGSGVGPAVAYNQDGSVNALTNPARWSQAVTISGTGPIPDRVLVYLSNDNNAFGPYANRVDGYSGNADGAAPGVKLVSFVLPKKVYNGDLRVGWLIVQTGADVYSHLPTIIYVVGP